MVARGPGHRAAGRRARRSRRSSSRCWRPGTIPAAEKLRAKFPAGRRRDDAARRAWGPSARGGCTRSWASTRSTRCAPRRPRARIRGAEGLRAEGRGGAARGARRPRRAARRDARRAAGGAGGRRADRRRAARACRRCERAEIAGSARRLADSVKDLDVVVASDDPARGRRGVRRARRHRRVRPRRRAAGRAASRRTGSRSTCGSSRRRRSATCSSTSAAPRSTTSTCARWRCAAACTSASTAILDDATGETHALRDRGGGLRAARACRTSSPSCARTAASWSPASTPPRARRRSTDLRGDLHCHTVASDGHATIEEMARAAKELGPRVPGDHRPLREPRLRQRRLAPRRSCATSPRSARSDARLEGHPRPRRQRGEHPARRLARLRRRPARAARLGRRERPHVVPDERREDDRADRRARSSIRSSTSSGTRPGRLIGKRAGLRRRHGRGDRRGGADRARSWRSTGSPTGATSTTCTRARRRPRA